MHPDKLVETKRHSGTGTLTDDESHEEITARYEIIVYDRMGWVGEGEPRIRMGKDIEGRVWVPGDQHWAYRSVGHRFMLTFEDGKRRLHILIPDQDGRIANLDSIGIHEK
jgi:hypothetical protein